jgi:Type III flagellar switch regulator (C-ring) FliN C-term
MAEADPNSGPRADGLSSEIDGLTGLRQIDAERADIANLLVAVLDGMTVDSPHGPALRVDASAHHSNSAAVGPWFTTTGRISFRIEIARGLPAVVDASRIDAVVDTLEAVDPLLDALEARMGIALEPTGISDDAAGTSLFVTVSCRAGAAAVHRLTLAVPPAVLNLALLHDVRAGTVCHDRDLPVQFSISFVAADLPVEDAADLDVGDLLLISAPARAQLQSPPGAASDIVAGLFDVRSGRFTVALHEGEFMAGNAQRGGFAVPVMIALPARTTSAETLAGLKPGVTFPLGPMTDGLQVDISVGGRPIARGELVQVGDQFAVLIEQRVDMDDLPDARDATGGE